MPLGKVTYVEPPRNGASFGRVMDDDGNTYDFEPTALRGHAFGESLVGKPVTFTLQGGQVVRVEVR